MRPGDVTGGRFVIGDVVASGGMGVVHAARDTVSGERVAVKRLARRPDEREVSEVERFAREARVLQALSAAPHPCIARYVAHGEDEEGTMWLALEWIEGETLRARLTRDGALTERDSLLLAHALADGLAAAHAHGIVHRDVKPSNIVLFDGRVDRPKLIDFGVARADGERTLTAAGTVIGTTGYMAPEQARGADDVDARADLFSLGCVLYHALAGVAPFAADDAVASLVRVMLEEPAPLTRASSEAARIVGWLLAKEPRLRASSARSVADRLAGAIAALDQRERADHVAASARERPSLGTSERVLRCIGVGRLAPEEGALTLAAIAPIVQPLGVDVDLLVGGGVLLRAHAAETALDEAWRVARAAEAIRAMDRRVAFGIVAAATDDVVRLLVVRASALLATATAVSCSANDAIRVDDVAARLLARRASIAHDAHGSFLVDARTTASSVDAAGPASGRTAGAAEMLVGRERELAALLGVAEECFGDREARMVLLTGPAGIGKSRLAREVTARVVNRAPRARVWRVSGDAVAHEAPLGLIAAVVRGAAGGATRDAIHELAAESLEEPDRSRVAAFLAHLASAEAASDRRETVAVAVAADGPGRDPLRTLVDLEAAQNDPGLMGDQVARAFIDLARASCTRTPLVIALEDLHAADLRSLEVLAATVRALERAPLLVVATARPSLHDRARRAFRPFVEETLLRELPRRAAEALARDAGAAPQDVALVVERAGGNPFFIEELARAASARIAAPDSVIAVLQARTRLLEPEVRRALRAASVLGRAFSTAAVARLVGATEEEVLTRLEAAQREQLVCIEGARWAFRHDLVRDAMYAMLTEEDHRLGHALAAEMLARHADERVEPVDAIVVAEHFERAAIPRAAAPWLARAAADALDANDFDAAIAHARRACALSDEHDGEARGAALALEAEAQRWRGDMAAVRVAGDRARSLLSRGTSSWCRAIGELAFAVARGGDDVRLRALGAELHAISADAREAPWALAAARVASQLAFAGAVTEARELVGSAAASRGATSARAAIDEALAFIAACSDAHPVAVCSAFERSAASFDAIGDRRNAARARVHLASALVDVGDVARAGALVEDALSIARLLGAAGAFVFGETVQARVVRAKGEPATARIILARLLGVLERTGEGDRARATPVRAELASLLVSCGDGAAAAREARVALEAGVARMMLASVVATLAEALVLTGAPEDALVVLDGRLPREARALDRIAAALARASALEALAARGSAEAARDAASAKDDARGIAATVATAFADARARDLWLATPLARRALT